MPLCWPTNFWFFKKLLRRSHYHLLTSCIWSVVFMCCGRVANIYFAGEEAEEEEEAVAVAVAVATEAGAGPHAEEETDTSK
jgi:hypothetical protein